MWSIPLPSLPWIASHPTLYPALEVVHILGISLLVGSLLLLDLRLWGRAPELPLPALARLALPVTVSGFALVAASGLLMFASRPDELLANAAFLWKVGLVGVAGLNAAVFHGRGGLARQDALARAQTVLSLGIWLTAIICGRWIAYQ